VPGPDLAPKDVLVKVRATTVTAGDSRLRSANVPRGFGVMVRLGFGIFGPRKPILGSELAGEVAAVGPFVSRFAPRDKVFAARMGCHAEYVAAPDDRVAPMPGNLTFGEAAAITFGGLPVLFYLRNKARIQPRERALINGASGAVGSAAVQLAKHFGTVVTGVRSLGADRVVDYAKEDFAQTGETYDVIFDAVGKDLRTRHRPCAPTD
jgi:NADPH:quinone reductase-like Zn-dependent oxidoreductase